MRSFNQNFLSFLLYTIILGKRRSILLIDWLLIDYSINFSYNFCKVSNHWDVIVYVCEWRWWMAEANWSTDRRKTENDRILCHAELIQTKWYYSQESQSLQMIYLKITCHLFNTAPLLALLIPYISFHNLPNFDETR